MDWSQNSERNPNCGTFWWSSGSDLWSWAARRSELIFVAIDAMGGVCSRRSSVDTVPRRSSPHVNGLLDHGSGVSSELQLKKDNNLTPPSSGEGMEKQLREFSVPEPTINLYAYGSNPDDIIDDGIPRLSRSLSHESRSTKPKQVAVAKWTRNPVVMSPRSITERKKEEKP